MTKRIQLATGIAIGLARSPFEIAMTALDLDHLSQSRFILGLGTGPEHFTKGYYGMPHDKPVSRLREVVQIMRHVEEGARTGKMKDWNGKCDQLEFHGYEPTAPPHRRPVAVRHKPKGRGWAACGALGGSRRFAAIVREMQPGELMKQFARQTLLLLSLPVGGCAGTALKVQSAYAPMPDSRVSYTVDSSGWVVM